VYIIGEKDVLVKELIMLSRIFIITNWYKKIVDRHEKM